ncbi:hypothetical protein ACFSJ3_09115 [Corallincola platygyrae]|uniref:Uncharacterized protein n=1 Tax=Corallincola platygyrae TaxID=1193278 RepID=A0ABW4XKR7_9GAMM
MPIGSVNASVPQLSNVPASTTSATLNNTQSQPSQEAARREQVERIAELEEQRRAAGNPEIQDALEEPQATQASDQSRLEAQAIEQTESVDRADPSDITDSRRAAGADSEQANVAAQPRIDVFV